MRTATTANELRRIGTLTDVGGFREKVLELRRRADDFCADKPFFVVVASCARSNAEQLENWKVGRLQTSADPAPFGTWKVVGKVVTKVRPGDSAHNLRAAADFGFIDPKGPGRADDEYVPDTVVDPKDPTGRRRLLHPAWDWLMREAEKVGIEAPGRRWGWDYGHLQLLGWANLRNSGTLIAVP